MVLVAIAWVLFFENTRRYLKENATAGSTAAGNIATLNRVILPVIRRVMPTVIANELVGVQPMTGPVGQIHTLACALCQQLDRQLSSRYFSCSW
jgi:hypothetical protein